jgi:tetratricopeptide (TPR) repeat protein
VSLDAELPDFLIQEPEPWLDVLRKHSAAFDSLDVLDDLVLLAGPAAEELDPGWDSSLLAPLLERAAAIVRESAAAAGERLRLPWGFRENRPALRLLSRLGYRLDGFDHAGEAALVYEEVLRWNPNDNHGHRTWLINHCLRKGDDARALEIADQYPDDALTDTLFGRGLALWRLGRRSEAEKALRAAAADRPLVTEALLAPELEEPGLTPGRVTMGGADEAWLYRESMRDVWLATPGALDFLRGLPAPPPGRGRRARSRRRKHPWD